LESLRCPAVFPFGYPHVKIGFFNVPLGVEIRQGAPGRGGCQECMGCNLSQGHGSVSQALTGLCTVLQCGPSSLSERNPGGIVRFVISSLLYLTFLKSTGDIDIVSSCNIKNEFQLGAVAHICNPRFEVSLGKKLVRPPPPSTNKQGIVVHVYNPAT
jgi:hypothetical protein